MAYMARLGLRQRAKTDHMRYFFDKAIITHPIILDRVADDKGVNCDRHQPDDA